MKRIRTVSIRVNGDAILLSAIVLLMVVANIVWIGINTVPPMWDQSHYLYISQLNYSALCDGGFPALLKAFLVNLQIKAPLITVLPIPLYLIFGNSYTNALYVNLVFVILGGFFIFKVGMIAYGRRAAVLSVIVFNTMPLIIGLSREFLVEYGLTVLVVMWVFLVLRSESFQERKWCLLLGVVLGCGMLMKISFASVHPAVPFARHFEDNRAAIPSRIDCQEHGYYPIYWPSYRRTMVCCESRSYYGFCSLSCLRRDGEELRNGRSVRSKHCGQLLDLSHQLRCFDLLDSSARVCRGDFHGFVEKALEIKLS